MSGKGKGPRLEVRLLGTFELKLDQRVVTLASRPAQSLFAYLVLSAGTPHRRERLATLLWPDADEENGRSYLRHALWRIRKALATDPPGPGFILSDDIAIRFDPASSHWLDVREFENGAGGSADELAASLRAYSGELLPGFLDEWAIRERERLEAVLPQRMERLIDRLSADARWSDLTESAERWISLGHAPESAYRALMRAHHEQGDRARTIATYQRCVEALRRDLDVEPSAQTRDLYERLTVAAQPPPVVPSPRPDEQRQRQESHVEDADPPFKGLEYFDEHDADLFFGREELTSQLARRLGSSSFLAVIGASGSGKSSLLRAGLGPLLRRSGRTDRGSPSHGAIPTVHVMTPTAHPLEALAVALTGGSAPAARDLLDEMARDPRGLRLHALASGQGHVIVVDQFEELFTLCGDPAEREEFVDNLLTASLPERDQPVKVVLALRADFYARCADYPALRDALARHQEYIGPIGPDDLRRAIELPARQRGWSIEAGLVDHLVHEVADEPGTLPLLSHALLETWHRREGRAMTLRGYVASGGVRGAIARTAETFFERADDTQRDIARRVFVRLTELGDGTEDTRRRASISELTSVASDPGPVSKVLRTLADARLITLAERTAEVSHEALIREWPRLREWLDQDRAAIRTHRQLTRSAIEWDRLGRDPGSLYRGARLHEALASTATSSGELTELERSFLAESRAQAESEARERLFATGRMRRRAQYLAAALVVLALMVGLAAYFAEQARASTEAAQLEQRRSLADSARAAADGVESRLIALMDAITSADLHNDLSLRAARETPHEDGGDLGAVLGSLRLSLGGDVTLLFMTDYRKDELLAIDGFSLAIAFGRTGPFLGGDPVDERSANLASAARSALSGTVPGPGNCSEPDPYHRDWYDAPDAVKFVRSQPYVPGLGHPPSMALTHYGPPCGRRPFGLSLEVTLRRANEWMSRGSAQHDDAFLVDATGRLVARTGGDLEALKDLSASELVANALRSEDVLVAEGAHPLGGGATLAAAAPVGKSGWRVLVVRPVVSVSGVGTGGMPRDAMLGALGVFLLIGTALAGYRARARAQRRRLAL